jgi:hypothetical protein
MILSSLAAAAVIAAPHSPRTSRRWTIGVSSSEEDYKKLAAARLATPT